MGLEWSYTSEGDAAPSGAEQRLSTLEVKEQRLDSPG